MNSQTWRLLSEIKHTFHKSLERIWQKRISIVYIVALKHPKNRFAFFQES